MRLQSPYLALAETVEEALAAKRRRPDARFVAGGTEVVADQNLGLLQPTGYVGLRGIVELGHIESTPDGVCIGAGVVVARLLDAPELDGFPLLRKAARAFGTRQVRNRATVGGNVASGLPDRTLTPCLLALQATVQVAAASGTRRTLPLAELLVAPRRTGLSPDELVLSITVPPVEGFQEYFMVGPRNAQFYPTASIALVVAWRTRDVRLGLGNAGPVAKRAARAEAFARDAIDWPGRRIDAGVAAAFGEHAAAACAPPSDVAAGADYRRHAVKVMARRALEQAFGETGT